MSYKWLKRLAAALALSMALCSVTGCSGGESSAAEGTAEASETSETKEPEAIKIGYIFNGDCSVNGFAADINKQRIQAASHTSIETEYIDNVSISGFEAAVEKLTADGCKYIVSCSPVFVNVLTSVAGKYMNVEFISYGARERAVNIYGYTENMFQGSYIAGVAAAFNSESERIGIVVDSAMIYPMAVINAAALGAQMVYQSCNVVVALATEDSEVSKAVDALSADGCDVIIDYTSKGAAVERCEKLGIKSVGSFNYGADAANYSNMLMYFYGVRDSFYLSQFKQIALEEWEVSAYSGTMANGIIAVSDALPACKEDTQAIMTKLEQKFSASSVSIFTGEIKDSHNSVRVIQGKELTYPEIYAMDWYVYGVEYLDSFVQSVTDPEIGELEIKQ